MYKLLQGSVNAKLLDSLHNSVLLLILRPAILLIAFLASFGCENLTNLFIL